MYWLMLVFAFPLLSRRAELPWLVFTLSASSSEQWSDIRTWMKAANACIRCLSFATLASIMPRASVDTSISVLIVFTRSMSMGMSGLGTSYLVTTGKVEATPVQWPLILVLTSGCMRVEKNWNTLSAPWYTSFIQDPTVAPSGISEGISSATVPRQWYSIVDCSKEIRDTAASFIADVIFKSRTWDRETLRNPPPTDTAPSVRAYLLASTGSEVSRTALSHILNASLRATTGGRSKSAAEEEEDEEEEAEEAEEVEEDNTAAAD